MREKTDRRENIENMKSTQRVRRGLAFILGLSLLLLAPAQLKAAAAETPSLSAEIVFFESAVPLKPVRLLINGNEVTLSDPIRNISGRIYYPFRSCLESMGAAVEWDGSTRTATGTLGGQTVAFTVGTSDYTINGISERMPDALPLLDTSLQRVYLPIRYAAEALGYEIAWIPGAALDTVSLTGPYETAVLSQTNAVQIDGRPVRLGDTKTLVLLNFGQPDRIDASAYGLQWYVYNRNYENFIMIGLAGDRVTGFFTNARDLQLRDNLGQGASPTQVGNVYGTVDTMEFWFDPNDGNGLYAVWCMGDKPADLEAEAEFLKNPEALLRTYETECLDITNAFRVRYDLPTVQYSAQAAKIARDYTKDMALRDYFSHTNPEGQGPLDRILAGGLDVQKVTENLAAGYPDAIQVLKGWVDSASHRKGMLESNEYLGVGAYYYAESKYQYYMAQEFYTPWH